MKNRAIFLILTIVSLAFVSQAVRLRDPQACKGNMMLPSGDANYENCKATGVNTQSAIPSNPAKQAEKAAGPAPASEAKPETKNETKPAGTEAQSTAPVATEKKESGKNQTAEAKNETAPSVAPENKTESAEKPKVQQPAPISQHNAEGACAAPKPGPVGYFLNSGQSLVVNQTLVSLNGRAKLELSPDCRVGLFYFDRLRWQSPAIESRDCSLHVTNDGKFVLRTKECDYALAQAQNPSVDSIYYQLLITNSGQLELHMTTVEASLKQYCSANNLPPTQNAQTPAAANPAPANPATPLPEGEKPKRYRPQFA